MRKKRKRIFALFLAILLCISSMQVIAAESGETPDDSSIQETERQPDGGNTSGDSSDTHDGTPDSNTQKNPDGQISTEPSDSVPDSSTENENSGENDSPKSDSPTQEPLVLAEARASSEAPFTNMPEGELLFLTLVDDTDYRWNVNGSGSKTNVLHLDGVEGKNCTFRLSKVEDENQWYGIKFIKDGGTDRYADIDGESKNEGAVLHLWEDSDKKVKDNPHRQFAFYDAGKDNAGNQMYYIKNRNSNLWVGMENDRIAKEQKLVQTSKRRRWYVTPCVVPKSGKELNLWEKNSKVSCEIFEKGTMEAINILRKKGMVVTNGMLLNTFVLGQNSRWILKWISKYEAYEIESVNQSTLGANPTDHVWDVDGESGGDADLNLWKRQSKDKNYNTSQLWRFIGSNAGNVKLQNARSGKYVVINAVDHLKQESNGNSFEVSLISHDAKNSESCQTDLDTEATTWMSKIPDGALLSSVNMPGTHDTGTAAAIQDMALVLGAFSLTQCQKYYFEEQLEIGARSFDIRCCAPSDTSTASQVKIIHGSKLWQCFDQWGNDLSLKWILDNAKEFLTKHDSESIVFMVKPDDGSTKGLTHALAEYMKSNRDLFWHSDSVPTMEEARGKIVLVTRFKVDPGSYTQTSDGAPAVSWFGPQLYNWDDYDYGDTAGLLEIHQNPGCYAQDAYNEGRFSKNEYIEGAMRDSTSGKIPGNAYIWNYTSSAMLFPLETTRSINPWLYEDKMNLIDNRRLGMVMLNFIDITTSRLIYKTNTNGNFFTPKCTFPDGLSVTYGDLMTEAEWKGASGDGTFSIDGSQKGYYPTREDVGKQFPMVFTPNDSRLVPVKQNVKLKELKPKEISVEIPAQTVEYGETISLTCNIPEEQLVGEDTKESLNIKLRLKGVSGNDRLNAGTYTIEGSFDNENYAVTFTGAKTLTVEPRQLNASWSDTTNIVYGMVNGKTDLDAWQKTGANVTASLERILDGDDCKAEITGGNETEPSWNGIDTTPKKYTAKITKLTGKDAQNYAIPTNNTKDYYIRRADADADDYCLPDSATVIYGEPLSKATLNGASGNGDFIFFKTNDSSVGNAMNEKPGGVGDYTYWIWYRPADSDTVKGDGKEIKVKVLPKPVTVNALDASKTYGDPSPAYSFDTEQAEKQMANNEDPGVLGLTLTARDGDSLTASVGTYPITRADCTNSNYDVTVIPAELKITRRQAELSWSNYDTRTYDGEASNVTASVTNLATDAEGNVDTCTVTVLGGKQTNAGDYSAVAVKLGNPNYQLKTGNLNRSYTIKKAAPTVTWPAATLTYGQTLSESTLTGGSATDVKGGALDGVFQFRSDCATVIPTVAQSGTESYPMEFIPSDTRNYNSALKADFKATVEKKPLQVEMLDTEKIYGDALEEKNLAVYYKESEIVGTDTVTVVPVVQKNGADISEQLSYADAGKYVITAKQSQLDTDNPNYAITIRDGRLTVKQRPVILEWSDTSDIVHGEPNANTWASQGANVTATVSNLVNSDNCTVKVEGGNETEPSANGSGSDKHYTVYYAIAKALEGTDSSNYTFTEEEPVPPKNPLDDPAIYENSRIMPYVIRQAEDCIMPLGAVLTYGQKFGDARMLAGSGDGTFKITDKNGKDVTNQIPDAGIYQDTYKVTFTPAPTVSSPNPDPVTSVGSFAVIVRKAPISVTARDAEKTYGEGKPAYEFDVSDPGLVNGDTIEGLLTVKSVIYEYGNDDSETPTGEISGDEKDSSADTYRIVLDKQQNKNYDLTFIEGTLTVHPLEVKIKWSDTSNIVYSYVDGKKDLEKWNETGANVTAYAANLINDDTCNLTCAGGDQKNAGEYFALVTGLDNPNYRLPAYRSSGNLSDSERLKEYTIKKATPDAVFPDKIIAQKGDVLGGLPYKATADTPGEFTFENPDTVLEKSGNYAMIFTPDDTRNYNTVNGTVYVELSEDGGQSGKPGSSGTDPAGGGSGSSSDNKVKPSEDGGQSGKTGPARAGSASTSDNSPVWLYLILLLMSGLTGIVLLRRRVK